MRRKRIQWIDYVRGIAIIAMIAGHSLGEYWPGYAVNLIFAVHMPIFFILSGYLYHEKSFKKTLFGGINNLLVPYATTVILEAIIVYIAHKLNNPWVVPRFKSVHELLYNAIYGVGAQPRMPFPTTLTWIGAIWFLLAMFIGTLIFHSIMRLHFAQGDLEIKVMLLVSIATFGAVLASYITLPFSLNAAMFSQIFFLSGYLIKKYHLLKIVNHKLTLMFFGIWLLSASLGIFFLDLATSPNLFVSAVGAISGSLVIFKFCIFLEQHPLPVLINRFLLFCGTQSLIILCIHLIDLDNFTLWYQITNMITTSTSSYLLGIVVGIIYRVFLASTLAFIISHLPILKSLYVDRNYPIQISNN